MGGFADLIYDVGTHFGKGLGAGALDEIKVREGERRTMQAWRRLSPFRREMEEEELGSAERKGKVASKLAVTQQYGTEAGEASQQPGFMGTKGLERERESAGLKGVRPVLQSILGPAFAQAPDATSRAEILREPRPYEIPEDVSLGGLKLLAGLAKTEKKEPRAPTMTEMQLRYAKGDPEAKLFFEGPPGAPQQGFIDVQRQVAGMRTRGTEDIRGGLSPEISPEERKRLGAHDAALGIVADIEQMLLPPEQGGMGAKQFVGKARGSATWAGFRRLGGALGAAPGVPEETFRATVQSQLNDAIRESAGATQTPTEVARQLQEIPSPDDTEEQFVAKLKLTKRNILRNKAAAETQLTQPRRRPLRIPSANKWVDRFGNITEE